ncbi:MAG: threonine--tRNA ligase [Gemmatimonadetes bacterium]|nr:threonine--tRNA ligase [Gemmatimonadota bacterium]
MRTLGIHAKRFGFESKEKAMAGAESLKQERHGMEIDRECLVLFVSVEKDDGEGPLSIAAKLAADTVTRAEKLGVGTVVLYPYVHLTENPSRPRVALQVLDEIERRLIEKLEVVRAPFGWYKAFDISCLGHPLSEWSGRYAPGEGPIEEEKKEERKPSEFVRFVAVGLEGEEYEVTPEDFRSCPLFRKKEPVYGMLRQFVSNELGRGVETRRPPKHIEYMQRHELVDYCDASEKGHYKWYPKGVLIQRLILDYAAQLAHDWGAFEMKNPIVIRGDHNVVGELMGEFHERDYQVDGSRGVCYLRYASDPLGFPFMQDVRFTYKQSPLKVYEEATCFRNEQEGEVSGLKRVRNFLMTDMHAACVSVEEAQREFETLCFRFAELMNDIIARGNWILGWEGTVDFFEENREWLVCLGKRMGVPAFFKLMPQMSHYYAMKNEFQSITEDKSNVQVSTVQWDVKDGERFNIGYVDEEGQKHPCPVIIHASSFGSIERTLCSILENIALDEKRGVAPMFPLWLSPTQARVVPVTDEYVKFAMEVCEAISRKGIRADVDDRGETVGKKIRNGEKEWVPYLLVVGEKEKESGILSVRSREDRSQEETDLESFVQMVKEKTEGMPFRPLSLPRRVSQRPVFYG